ncbi:MAG: chlorophyll a/b-binding protein [Leptolyngbyaceae bacterium]|nr:chlorophyll a/b-binding protein [Leptolyngbyaceae bacterium]
MTTNEDSTLQANHSPENSPSTPTQEPQSPEDASTVSTEAEKTEAEPLAQPEPTFGWTAYAEQINGRFAMVGFVLLLILEAVTGQDFFTWIGLR